MHTGSSRHRIVEFEIVALRRFDLRWRLVNLWQVDLYKGSKTWPHNNLVYLACHISLCCRRLQLPNGGWKDIRVRNSRSSRRADGALSSLDKILPKEELSRRFLKFGTCLERRMVEESERALLSYSRIRALDMEAPSLLRLQGFTTSQTKKTRNPLRQVYFLVVACHSLDYDRAKDASLLA